MLLIATCVTCITQPINWLLHFWNSSCDTCEINIIFRFVMSQFSECSSNQILLRTACLNFLYYSLCVIAFAIRQLLLPLAIFHSRHTSEIVVSFNQMPPGCRLLKLPILLYSVFWLNMIDIKKSNKIKKNVKFCILFLVDTNMW